MSARTHGFIGTVTLITLLILFWGAFCQAEAIYPGKFTSSLTGGEPFSPGKGRPLLWSPDSSVLIFARPGRVVRYERGGQELQELWAYFPSAAKTRKLTDNGFFPTFSTDGKKLAFVKFLGPGKAQLMVLEITTGKAQPLRPIPWGSRIFWTARGLLYQDGQSLRVQSAEEFSTLAVVDQARLVSVSPDGRWIILHRDNEVVLRDLSSGEERTLFRAVYLSSVAWLPDSSKAAMFASTEPGSVSLWVVEPAAGQVMPLWEAESEIPTGLTWSPDGDALAFARYPLGAGTAESADIWLLKLDTGELHILISTPDEDGTPLWSPDGRFIAFRQADEVRLISMEGVKPQAPIIEEKASVTETLAFPPPLATLQVSTPLSAPETILVKHNPDNWYRSDVPAGQIDELDFETYVKQVVPYEMPASWPMEALKAQAVAARTYGWYFVIAHEGWDYHVTDWVEYQVMGPDTYPTSNEAVDATAGQYIAYEGQVILAEYSAEHGSPTLPRYIPGTHIPDPNYPYLSPVYDPVGFGRPRRGHGRGMSQWGARRWVEQHNWDYQKILCHYYTGVVIQKAFNPVDGEAPLSSVVYPWSDFYLNTSKALIMANASDENSGVKRVDFYIRYACGTEKCAKTLSDSDGSDGWSVVWDMNSVSDQALEQGLEFYVRAYDNAGHYNAFPTIGTNQGAYLGLDRVNPAGVAFVTDKVTSSLYITISFLATDSEPGRVKGVALSNGWIWEGEELYREVVDGITVGRTVSDPEALNGYAVYAEAGVDPAGAWYGPYTTVLEPGRPYRAIFRIKTDDVLTTGEIALLDVVQDGGAELLGIRRLRGIDFREPLKYQEFPVDFYYWEEGEVEFRLAFRGVADVYLDRVLVTSYPITYEEGISLTWKLPPDEGEKTVLVKFFDAADNVSEDVSVTFSISDVTPPGGWRLVAPSGWVGMTTTVTCTAYVVDNVTGIAPDGAAYRFSTDGGLTWSDWLSSTVVTPTLLEGYIIAPAVPFTEGISNCIQFRAMDLKGLVSVSPIYTIGVDVTPPVARIHSPEFSLTATFVVSWTGEDDLSGIESYDVEYRVDEGPWEAWLTRTVDTEALFRGVPGHTYTFRVRGRDLAGNTGLFSPDSYSTTETGFAAFLPLVIKE